MTKLVKVSPPPPNLSKIDNSCKFLNILKKVNNFNLYCPKILLCKNPKILQACKYATVENA